MQNKGKSLGEAEQKAFVSLKPELEEHSRLSEGVLNLILNVLNQLPEMSINEMPQSLKIAISLLTRISNDLRCIALLANCGYSVQAASLAASTYEAAFTVVYIGNDENLAKEWIDHDDPTKLFRNIRTITEEGLKKLGVSNVGQQANIEYQRYRQLCLPKHSNPLFQMQHGIIQAGNTFLAINGPDTSDTSVRDAWFALEHASALALHAIASFVANHGPKLQELGLEKELETFKILGAKRKELESRAKQRWGTKDPFPGKW